MLESSQGFLAFAGEGPSKIMSNKQKKFKSGNLSLCMQDFGGDLGVGFHCREDNQIY